MFVKLTKNNIIIMKIKSNIKFGYKHALIANIGISINKISNDIKKLICESILALRSFLVFTINKSYLAFIIGIKIIAIFEKIVNSPNSVGEYSLVIIGVVMINMT
ncbi:capsular polysaccharide synthesis enzyme Cap8K [Staphylococcus aureus subsp. aureus 103564]|nr:capsular polysaccharide synthesis enzyme Cap8K [Staphylococcus aureus subsp. aureus 103564]